MKVIFLRGLPGSGKSTWAMDQVATHHPNMVRVNKDAIRKEMGVEFSRDRMQEYQVLDRRDDMVCKALEAGKDVIVDDTNFGKKHEPRLRELAARYGAEFILNESFLSMSVEECIARDDKRSGTARVGPSVIWGMAEAHLGIKKPEPPLVVDLTLPAAVICDLDGTLSLNQGKRGWYDYEKCDLDVVNHPVKTILQYFAETHTIIYMSGRERKAYDSTMEFLKKNHCPIDLLFMRTTGDYRKDFIVKEELYAAHILGKYRVEFVLDDRDQVVKMWRDLGLCCLQVNYGSY